MLRLITFLAAVALASLAAAQPLTTAFTFQGELNNAGSPATGLYDFKFGLSSTPPPRARSSAPSSCADNIAVANGNPSPSKLR